MRSASSSNFVQYGVRVVSVTYVVLGLVGFLPFKFVNPMHHQGIGAHYLLNIIAINWLHNCIHLGIGAFGLWAAPSLSRCRVWGRVTGAVLLVVLAAGIAQAATLHYPVDQLLLGLVPLNAPGHMLHLTTALLALYLGFAPVEIRSRA